MCALVVLAACGGDGGHRYAVYLLTPTSDTCDAVRPFVPGRDAPEDLRGALDLLVAGVPRGTALRSMFTAETAGAVRSVEVRRGTAHVDFDDFSRTIPNASASCGSQALLAQLDSTVRQFPGVERGRYSFAGDESAFYEWLQLGGPED